MLFFNLCGAILTGVTQNSPPSILDLKTELRTPISLTNLFEVVADDLLTLNKNLQSVSARFENSSIA